MVSWSWGLSCSAIRSQRLNVSGLSASGLAAPQAKAGATVAKAATCDALKEAILAHLEETEGHVTKVEEVFGCFDT